MKAIQINRKQLYFCSALSTLTQCFIRRCCPQSRAFSFICLTNRNAAGFQELLEDGFWPAKIIAQQISTVERNEHPVLCRLRLMANKTFRQGEPTALSCCWAEPQRGSGMQHLPGQCLGMHWDRDSRGQTQQTLSPSQLALASHLPCRTGRPSRAGRCLPSVPGHVCRRAKRKYQFLSLCMNCKANACPSFGSQFRTALRQRLCNASGLQGASINH